MTRLGAVSGNARDGFRASLPILENQIYLDNAGVAPLSTLIQTRMVEMLTIRAHQGKMGLKAVAPAAITALKTRAASLLGASPREVAMTQNTTMGLNMIAQGMQWCPGDTVLVPDNEFPANVYPWLALSARGVVVRRITTRNGVLSPADIAAHMDPRTRLLALSHVGYISGFRANLEAIGALCKSRGVRFVVDAAQSLGVHPIDVQAFGIDALACSGWKWLMGPVGIGLLFCSSELAQQLTPPLVGAGSIIGGEATPASLPFEFHPDAGRFEFSSIDPSAIAGLATAIEVIAGFGVPAIEQQVRTLVLSLRARLRTLGWTAACDVQDSDALSGIVSVRKAGIDSQRLVLELHERGLHCAHWNGYLRLSPHFYNSESDIESLISHLPS